HETSRYGSGGGRIQNGSGRHGPAEKVGLSSRLSGNQFGEIGVTAAPLQCGRHAPGVRRSLAAAQSFVVSEDENFILDDRPADGHAELVQSQFAFFRGVADALEI